MPIFQKSLIVPTITLTAVTALILIPSCASNPKLEIMSPPELMDAGVVDPYEADRDWLTLDDEGILFATVRRPAGEDGKPVFSRERDTLLHLGEAEIVVSSGESSWEELQDLELLKSSSGKYPVTVEQVEIFGPLDAAFHDLVEPSRIPADPGAASRRYIDEVNRRLERNPIRELFVYVHGVNTTFESPLLLTAEFWHYLGYRGVPIAFSWPSVESITGYVGDVDTAEYTVTMFRRLVQFLYQKTEVERINIMAYSAGTKLTAQALHQLSLLQQGAGAEPGEDSIGRVAFVAGDIERSLFGMYLADGLLDITDNLLVYMSETDRALNMSESIRRSSRLGQKWDDSATSPVIQDYLRRNAIDFVDVTGQEGTRSDYGHSYFRNSPQVSSDLVAFLGLGLSPGERGLEKHPDHEYWYFPEDYRLRLESLFSGEQTNGQDKQ